MNFSSTPSRNTLLTVERVYTAVISWLFFLRCTQPVSVIYGILIVYPCVHCVVCLYAIVHIAYG